MPPYAIGDLKVVPFWDKPHPALDTYPVDSHVEGSFTSLLPACSLWIFIILALLLNCKNQIARSWTPLIPMFLLLLGWYISKDSFYSVLREWIYLSSLKMHYGDLLIRMQIMAIALLSLIMPRFALFEKKSHAYGVAWAGTSIFGAIGVLGYLGFSRFDDLWHATLFWIIWSASIVGSYALASRLCRRKYTRMRFYIALALALLMMNMLALASILSIDLFLGYISFADLSKRMVDYAIAVLGIGSILGFLTILILFVYSFKLKRPALNRFYDKIDVR